MPARLELYKSVSLIEEAKLDWLEHYRWPKNPRGSTLKSRLDKQTYSTWRRTWARFAPHSEPPDRLRPYFAYKEVLRKYEAHFGLKTKMFQHQVGHIARRYGIPVARPVLVWNVADPELTWKGLSRMSPRCFAASLVTLQQSTFARLYWRAKAWSVGYMSGLKHLGYSSGLFVCNWNSQVLARAGMPNDYQKIAVHWWAQYVAAAARKYHVIVVIERVSTLEDRGITDLIKLGATVKSPNLTSPGSATALQIGAGAPIRSMRPSFQSPRAADRKCCRLASGSSK